jgi:hypothetical protein
MVITKTVPVVALVKAGQIKEVGGRVTGRDGAFQGAFTGVNQLGQNILVGDDASKSSRSLLERSPRGL